MGGNIFGAVKDGGASRLDPLDLLLTLVAVVMHLGTFPAAV